MLMCCSDPDTVKGGMVTVVNNYLSFPGWKKACFRFIPTHREGNKLVKSVYFALASLRVSGVLMRKQVDIVHLHTAERGSFYRKAYLLRLCRRFGVPVILHHHAAEFEEFYESLGERKKKYVKRILEQADVNLVLSEFLKDKLLEKAPNAKIEILHNAVETKHEYSYQEDRTGIVMLGRQGERKGSYDLLEAVALIRDELPDGTRLWLCGDGDVAGVKRRAEQLGIADMIAHIGWMDKEEIEDCLRHAAIHILPSRREGLPMSILETMSRGIPNVATRIASIPEVIRDGETGILLEPGNIDEIADAIRKLMGQKDLRREIGESGYELVRKEFSMEGCVKRLEEIYEDILKQKQEA